MILVIITAIYLSVAITVPKMKWGGLSEIFKREQLSSQALVYLSAGMTLFAVTLGSCISESVESFNLTAIL